MAKHLMRYLDCLDLSDREQFAHLSKQGTSNFQVDNSFLKKESLVLPGAAIFHILFEGTKGRQGIISSLIIIFIVQYLERIS
jgi:hypothetical protein